MNGRVWDIRNSPRAISRITSDATWNSSIYSRTLTAEREYNNTSVQCVLTLSGGGRQRFTAIMHSFLSEVSKIIKFFIMFLLFFTADFSLTPKSMNVTLGGLVEFDCYPYYPNHNIIIVVHQ